MLKVCLSFFPFVRVCVFSPCALLMVSAAGMPESGRPGECLSLSPLSLSMCVCVCVCLQTDSDNPMQII